MGVALAIRQNAAPVKVPDTTREEKGGKSWNELYTL